MVLIAFCTDLDELMLCQKELSDHYQSLTTCWLFYKKQGIHHFKFEEWILENSIKGRRQRQPLGVTGVCMSTMTSYCLG